MKCLASLKGQAFWLWIRITGCYSALQSKNAVTAYLVEIEFRSEMGFIMPPLSCVKKCWSNFVPFQRKPVPKMQYLQKRDIFQNKNAVSDVTAVFLLFFGIKSRVSCRISLKVRWQDPANHGDPLGALTPRLGTDNLYQII